ncbi:SRPBCC family protein [Alteromonas oceanisediminis]|uniref:SRPBCC family protein n=1 Tax=Alteromonas oceanisediminis TaxID=2836180 RepID=UPI001BD96DA1|nr:SRPBCC domain-containing protein [Alteromonas oceanisediminis]MBT0585245.1 SRPBCC domain-containing protein [Alteromonas oceanisediminis]
MFQLSLTLLVNADAEKAFTAFSVPEKLIQWFAPGDAQVTQVMANFTVGGRYALTMREPNGEEFQLVGEYLAIEDNAHLRYSWAWADAREETVMTEVDVVFVETTPDTTEITLTHSGFANEAERDQHQHGWVACLEKLSRLTL